MSLTFDCNQQTHHEMRIPKLVVSTWPLRLYVYLFTLIHRYHWSMDK